MRNLNARSALAVLLFGLVVSGFTPLALAASAVTHDVKIELISVDPSTGNLLIQTNPRHSIEGLSCTNTYWITLARSATGYDSVLSMLLSSQRAGSMVTVQAGDDNGYELCKLERLITS